MTQTVVITGASAGIAQGRDGCGGVRHRGERA